MASLLQRQKNAIVLFNYDPKEHDELKLIKGEQIIVLEETTENDGWSLGQNQDGVKGIYPSNYVSVQSDEASPPPRPKQHKIMKKKQVLMIIIIIIIQLMQLRII